MSTLENHIEKLKQDLENQQKENALLLELANLQLPKNGLTQKVNILTALALIKQDMAIRDLVVIFDEADMPSFKQRKDGAIIDYFENNKKVDLESYITDTLKSKQFLQEQKDQEEQHQMQPAPGARSNPWIAAESAEKLAQLTS